LDLFASRVGITSPLGLAIAGPLTDALGPQLWYVLAGVICVGVGAVGYVIPDIINVEKAAVSS
jgi:hypothetical protein